MDACFKTFASKGAEATGMDINKWAKDAGILGKNLTSNHIDIAYSKCKPPGGKYITLKEMDCLIGEMAKAYMNDKKIDLEAAKAELKDKLTSAESKAHGTTAAMNVGGVDRLTDTSKYTGAHKERFDESGKGKGLAGTSDLTSNTGYVQGYKNKDTYEKK